MKKCLITVSQWSVYVIRLKNKKSGKYENFVGFIQWSVDVFRLKHQQSGNYLKPF